MNRAGLDIIQVDSLDQVQGQCVYPLVDAEQREAFQAMVRDVFQGKSRTLEFKMRGLKGQLRFLYTHAVPLRNDKGEIVSALSVTIDITDRKMSEDALHLNQDRLETLLELTTMNVRAEKELAEFALEEAVRLTSSKGGYLHFFNADDQTIQLYSWSKDVLKICTASQDEHYPLDKAGVWADSVRLRKPVIHNDYQNLADKKGYPEGHFHLIRHLGVPILDGERVVGVAGVGNKETPYNEIDAVQINLFLNSMWNIFIQKKTEKERDELIIELRDALAKVRTLSEMLPICSYCKKIRDDKGYWEGVETYISKHTDTVFTHGMCPVCAEKVMKDIEEFKDNSGL